MLVVAAIFATSDVAFVKQFCVGILVAVVVDATLVRAVLVRRRCGCSARRTGGCHDCPLTVLNDRTGRVQQDRKLKLSYAVKFIGRACSRGYAAVAAQPRRGFRLRSRSRRPPCWG